MKKKAVLLTLILSVFIMGNINAQFGIGNSIKNKYKNKYKKEAEKKGEEQAEKGLKSGEDAGMEQAEKGENAGMEHAEKGLEKAQPGLEKAEEGMDKGAEATIFGLGKYEAFQDDYKSRRDNANPDDYRKYPFETAIVEYKLEGKIEGEKSYYVYGAGYKMAEYIVEKKGNKIKENTGIITIGPYTTTIDFIEKEAVEMENPFLLFSADPNRDWQKTGENILTKTGFEKTGKETIIGKECNLWVNGNDKLWIWKGLVLKIQNRNSSETATSVKIDVTIPAEKFQVPEDIKLESVNSDELFPDITAEEFEEEYYNSKEEEEEMLEMIADMSYSEFKAMVKKEDPEMTDNEIQQAYLYLKQKSKMRNK
ncbi:MAG: hypothetical protein QM503_07225 [Bacteroidota bacterium]